MRVQLECMMISLPWWRNGNSRSCSTTKTILQGTVNGARRRGRDGKTTSKNSPKNGFWRFPEDSGRQGTVERYCYNIIRCVPTTVNIKGVSWSFCCMHRNKTKGLFFLSSAFIFIARIQVPLDLYSRALVFSCLTTNYFSPIWLRIIFNLLDYFSLCFSNLQPYIICLERTHEWMEMSQAMIKCVLCHMRKKGADQPAHPRSLISAFDFAAKTEWFL